MIRRSDGVQLETALAELEDALGGLDVNCLVGDEPARLLELVAGCEKRLAAARVRLAHRVEETKAYRSRGHVRADRFVAETTGTSVGEAQSVLATGDRLQGLPEVGEAFDRGEVSEAQAKAIASAASVDPSAQGPLLGKARSESLYSLKQECGKVRAAAETDEATRRARQHANRSLRMRTDAIDGMFKGEFALPPELGAILKARLDAETDRVFRQARQDNRREPLQAYAADALVNLALNHTALNHTVVGATDPADPATSANATDPADAESQPNSLTSNSSNVSTGNGSGAGRVRAEVVIDIDLAALRRGHSVSGETCEIRGIGPVAVEAAKEMLDDAFIKAVIHDGTDIKTVVHYGRHVPAELMTAILFRDRRCAVPGCDRDARLEIDHAKQDYADGGPLALWNADRLCGPHHQLKTHAGHQLLGQPGGPRTWTDDNGDIVAQHPGGPDPEHAGDQGTDTSAHPDPDPDDQPHLQLE